MSINIGDKPEMNVVNVGDELTQEKIDAINASAVNGSPSGSNPFLTRTNTFNTADTAVRITQTGAGDAFRVEDSANPDTSPFIVSADGRVGIGTTTLATGASVTASGTISAIGFTVSGATASTISVNSGTAVPLTITNAGTGHSFVVNDQSADATPFVIDNAGGVVLGDTAVSAGYKLDVRGAFRSSNASTGSLFEITSGSAVPLTITNAGTGNSFVVNDASGDSSPFVVNADGKVGVSTASPSYELDVTGDIRLTSTLRFGDGTTQTTAAAPFSTNFPVNFGSVLNEYASFYTSGAPADTVTLELGSVGNTVGYFSNKEITINDISSMSSTQYQVVIAADYEGVPAISLNDVTNNATDVSIGETGITFHTAAANPFGITTSGVAFPDGTTQTTAATGGSSVLDTFEQTVTWTQTGVSSPTLTPHEFASRMTNNGMVNSVFQSVGSAYATTGCLKAILKYIITVECTSASMGHAIASGPTGELKYWDAAGGSTNPYGDLDPTNPGYIAYAYESYFPTPSSYLNLTMTPIVSVTFTDTHILGNDIRWVFPSLSVSETASSSADWRITVYVKVDKGV